MEDNLFSSTIFRFGPIITPQFLQIDDDYVQYSKYKFINYFGVAVSSVTIDRKFINAVELETHMFTGTEILIKTIDGKSIHLKNFRRKDGEKINELILK